MYSENIMGYDSVQIDSFIYVISLKVSSYPPVFDLNPTITSRIKSRLLQISTRSTNASRMLDVIMFFWLTHTQLRIEVHFLFTF